jgi:hypothetical protein
MTDYREPELEHLYDMRAELDAPQPIGLTPLGMRQTWIVTGGSLEGPRMKGEVLPGGGDWARIRSDGGVQLDVRATAKTDDGAFIHTQYSGLIIMTPEVQQRVFSAEDVPLDEYYFFTNPMFQTGHEKYAWLNDVVAVGRGKVVPGAVEYRVWALR